jgi:predicted lipoprotein with Yx(FWY)xxD motif
VQRPKQLVPSRRVLLVTAVIALAAAGLATAHSRPSANIHLAETTFGTFTAPRLQNGHHYAIYISTHDLRDKSRCYGMCTQTFQPVVTYAGANAWNGVRRKLLGIINRGHGVRQVTYNHHPLYTSDMDSPGNATMDGCLFPRGLVVRRRQERQPRQALQRPALHRRWLLGKAS